MEFNSKDHEWNYNQLLNHTDFDIPRSGKSNKITITEEGIIAKSYDIEILKVNKKKGGIYFDRDTYYSNKNKPSKTTTELQNIVEKWLVINKLRIIKLKHDQKEQLEDLKKEDLQRFLKSL